MAQVIESSAIEEALAAAVERLVALLSPARVVLFGSRARGSARRDSDLDLLVVLGDESPTAAEEDAAYVALGDLSVPIDLVLVSQSDVRAYGGLVGTVLYDGLREGLTLYVR